jgi:hypothetical protein
MYLPYGMAPRRTAGCSPSWGGGKSLLYSKLNDNAALFPRIRIRNRSQSPCRNLNLYRPEFIQTQNFASIRRPACTHTVQTYIRSRLQPQLHPRRNRSQSPCHTARIASPCAASSPYPYTNAHCTHVETQNFASLQYNKYNKYDTTQHDTIRHDTI